MSIINLLLVDDHKVMRQGLRSMFTAQPDLRVLGEAANGQEAIKLAVALNPDIILMDVMLRNLNGIDIAQQIFERGSKARIIFLTMHTNINYAVWALQNGAMGYVLKDADFSEVLKAIHEVMMGRRYLSTTIADDVLAMLISHDAKNLDADSADDLSPRQREVLKLIAEGYTNNVIAEILKLSVRTIETHRARLMERLGIGSQAELVRFAVQQGLVAPYGQIVLKEETY